MIRRLALAALLATSPAPLPAAAGTLDLAPREPLTVRHVEELLAPALPEAGPGRRLEPRITRPRLPLTNPSDRPVSVTLEGLEVDPHQANFVADLVVRVDGTVTGVVGLGGALRPVVEVPAPLQPIREGQLVEPALLGTVWWPESELAADVLLAAEDIVGREAERRLAPGRPVRQADLRAPRLVRKGETVTLVYRRAGIELTALARALQDGAEGERIRAVNLDSERPVSGLVIARRTLLVGGESVP